MFDMSTYVIGLTMCSTISSLVTQAIKKLLDENKIAYSTNIIVAVVSALVGALIVIYYMIYSKIEISPMSIISAIIFVCLSWLGSMVGYDKVKQAITQVKDE